VRCRARRWPSPVSVRYATPCSSASSCSSRSGSPGCASPRGGDVALVLGPTEELPWVDGAEWLGADPEVPALLLPTALDPTWPLDLLQARVVSARGGRSGAVAMLAGSRRLVATGAATSVDLDVVREALVATADKRGAD
jgi:hypothetical protein